MKLAVLTTLLFIGNVCATEKLYGQNHLPDTSQVNELLRKVNIYTSALNRDSVLKDSSLLLVSTAIKLSKTLNYDSGLINSYIAEYQIYVKTIERRISHELEINQEIKILGGIELKILKHLSNGKHHKWLGEIFLTLAKMHNDYTKKTYNYKLTLYDQSIRNFQLAKNLAGEALVWYSMGYTHHVNHELTKAENAYLKSISLSSEAGVKKTQHIYSVLGNIYVFTGNLNLALKYELDALKIAESNKDTLELGDIHLYLGLIYERLKDNTSALNHYQIACSRFEKDLNNHLKDFTYAIGNTAKMLIANNPDSAIALLERTIIQYPQIANVEAYGQFPMRLMQANMRLKNIADAQRYCNELLVLNKKYNNPGIYSAVIRFFINTKQYTNAEHYLELFHSQANSRGTKPLIADAYHFRYQIDSAKQNHKSALTNHLRYTALSAEILNEAKAKEIAALQVQYDTEQKEKDILVLKQKGELQEAKLEQSHLMRNITFAGAALSLFIAGLLFRQYKVKQNTNKKLAHLLTEKEWLLKEVHHRVKNNLQTVVSLLESQARSLKDEALGAIQDSQNRVYAMSLIHKKLYQATDVASVNMKDYLPDLVQHLRDGLSYSAKIRYSLEIESIELDVSQAVPVGLIINEAVTNSIKHAFPISNDSCQISISLTKSFDEKICLVIADNGVGMIGVNENSQSMGLRLMKGLTEDIDGTFTIQSQGGVSIKIEFIANIPFRKIEVPGTQLSS